MPSYHHPDDAKRISARLAVVESLGPNMRQLVCDAYAKAYLEAWDAEPVPHKKHNKARFAANSRLRIFMDRRFAVFNK